ncbi:hypothetical protein TYRP_020732 [Tyrophagus putrescentiae]|nr:hypothetical protein TYRP_020732 [Tyrophagus putrescentiae]
MNSSLCVSTSPNRGSQPAEAELKICGPAMDHLDRLEEWDSWAKDTGPPVQQEHPTPLNGPEWSRSGAVREEDEVDSCWEPDEDVEDWRGGVAATRPLVTWLCSREVRNLCKCFISCSLYH